MLRTFEHRPLRPCNAWTNGCRIKGQRKWWKDRPFRLLFFFKPAVAWSPSCAVIECACQLSFRGAAESAQICNINSGHFWGAGPAAQSAYCKRIEFSKTSIISLNRSIVTAVKCLYKMHRMCARARARAHPPTHIHTYTHTHTHTHTHTNTHTYTDTYTHTHTDTYTHILTRTRTRTLTHAHTHTHTHARTHARTHAHTHTHKLITPGTCKYSCL